MAITHVQDNHGNANATSASVTLSSNVTGGNLLLAEIGEASVAAVYSITDTQNNRWIQIGQSLAGANAELWMARAAQPGATTVKVTLTTSASVAVNVSEWAGALWYDPLDQWSQNTATSASVITQNVQPRVNGDLVVAVGASSASVSGPLGGGYTALTMGGTGYAAAYSILTGSVASIVHWNTTGTPTWGAIEACFRPSGGVPAYSNPLLQFPETLVQIAGGTNFLAPVQGVGVWTNISSYVMSMTLGPIGRQHELDRVQSSAGQFSVNNRDGSFNSWNTQSFLYQLGCTDPMSPVQVTASWQGNTSPIYFGYIQSVTPNIADVLNVNATISCYDILQMLSLKYLSNNNYAQLVAADGGSNLKAFYRLGDTAGNYSVHDSSGNGYTGSLVANTAGDPLYGASGPFLYDSSTALDLTNGQNVPNGGFNTIDKSTEPPTVHNPLQSAGFTFAIEIWFKWTGQAANVPSATVPNAVLTHFTSTGSPTTYELQIGYATQLASGVQNTFANAYILTDNSGDLGVWVANGTPFDGKWHHAVFEDSGIFSVDGQTANFIYGGFSAPGSVTNMTFGCPPGVGLDPSGGTLYAEGLTGTIANVALYASELTATQVANHYNTGTWFQQQEFGASVGTSAAGRFNKVMAVAGLPSASMLNVPYPFKTLMYEDADAVTTTSALNYMQTLTETEPGLIYQAPNGQINAFSRQYQYLNPTSASTQGIVSDSNNSGYYYDGTGLMIASDDLDVWNDVQVASGRTGAQLQEWGPVQSAVMASSAIISGSRTLQGLTSLQMEMDSDALAIAQNYAAWYGTPINRVTQVVLNSVGNGGQNLVLMLGLDLMDHLTIQYNGQTPGTPFSQNSLVEQITHTVDMSNPTWATTFAMSPYEILVNPFIFANGRNQLSGAASVTGSGTSWIQHKTGTALASGTVTYTVASGATTTVPYNATAAQVQTALAALVSSTTVSGGPISTANITVTFGSSQGSFSAYFTSGNRLTL